MNILMIYAHELVRKVFMNTSHYINARAILVKPQRRHTSALDTPVIKNVVGKRDFNVFSYYIYFPMVRKSRARATS